MPNMTHEELSLNEANAREKLLNEENQALDRLVASDQWQELKTQLAAQEQKEIILKKNLRAIKSRIDVHSFVKKIKITLEERKNFADQLQSKLGLEVSIRDILSKSFDDIRQEATAKPELDKIAEHYDSLRPLKEKDKLLSIIGTDWETLLLVAIANKHLLADKILDSLNEMDEASKIRHL